MRAGGRARGCEARAFLVREDIPILVERLGGTEARQIYFDTGTGKVELRAVKSVDRIVAEELAIVREPVVAAQTFDVEDALF